MKKKLLDGLVILKEELIKAEQTIQVRGAIVHCENLMGEVASINEESFAKPEVKTESKPAKKAEEVKVVAPEIVSPELKEK